MASPFHPLALTAAWMPPEMLIPFGGLLLTTCQFLKGEIKNRETRLREEMKASEARQREALSEVKGELKSPGDKLGRVVKSLLASRSRVHGLPPRTKTGLQNRSQQSLPFPLFPKLQAGTRVVSLWLPYPELG